MAITPQKIMDELRSKTDAELLDYATEHQNDPYMFPLAFQEGQRRKHLRAAQQAQGGANQPKVTDQAIAEMAMSEPLPEDVGIAQLGAPNMENFADGGIVAFAGGGTPFAQWLAERGITMQQYAQLPASEQQLMREVFRNPGPTMPAAAAPVAAEAAAPVAAEAATTGRAYQVGKTLGKGMAKAGPAIVAGEVLGNLGGYKFQEPDLDTSVGGVYDALKAGKYSQAGRNLVMGLPEAGYDLLRSGAGLGDYLLPGQPLAEGVDKAVKYFHGDKITTPSDTARTEEAAKKATDAQKAANAAAAKAKEDFKITSGTPTGNVMGSRRTPLQLAEEAAKNEAAAKERTGLANLMKMPSVGAPVAPTAQSGLGSIAEFAKEANAYTGADPTARQLARIEKQEAGAAGEKKDAFNMALLKAGLGMMAGTSQHAFENIGKGAMGGLEDYAGTMKELKKAALERDKMRDAAEQAAYAYKRDDVKGYRDAKEKEAQRAAELQRTQMTIAGQLQAAGIGRLATLEAARMPGAQERFYAAMGDPNSTVAKGFKYASEVGAEAKANPALVAQYAKNPMALEMLKTTDPILYASIKQQMLTMAMPQVQTAPTGEIRR